MSEFRAGPGAEPAVFALRPAEERRVQESEWFFHPPRPKLPALPFELAAFEGVLDQDLLETAARRAHALGVGGDEVLRAHGIVSADRLTVVMAERLGLTADRMEYGLALASPKPLEAVRRGVLALRLPEGAMVVTVAPRGLAFRRLADALRKNPKLRSQLRLTSPERLSSYVKRAFADQLAAEAVYGLHALRPDLSAVPSAGHPLRWGALGVLSVVAAAAVLVPAEFLMAVEYFLGFCFLLWIALRLVACSVTPERIPAVEISSHELPVYSIVVPLYRETNMVQQLAAALRRLHYPPEKLDIKFVLEADDIETRLAVAAASLPASFEVIVAPQSGPRTKPKALAVALPFIRGEFVVVYDAEDMPEPDQLRTALSAFHRGPEELACVQARLAIYNARDSWLSRHFTAEYAGLFDVFLPALAKLKFPLPLGGTSNHFRTAALRQTGGWDPFNVTEDADLGMRLARFGFHSGVIVSTTWEEAPIRFGQWIRQRTRWFKGWMQTWLVHMRAPALLRREMGLRGFLSLQLFVGGTVLAALVHPLFMLFVINDFMPGGFFKHGGGVEESIRGYLSITVLAGGYVGSAALALAGLRRRGMAGGAWVLLTIPVYWLLLSAAAWRALFQLFLAPHLWEKTEHGFTRKPPAAGSGATACTRSVWKRQLRPPKSQINKMIGRGMPRSQSKRPRPIRTSDDCTPFNGGTCQRFPCPRTPFRLTGNVSDPPLRLPVCA